MKKFYLLLFSMSFTLGCSVDPVESDHEDLLNAKATTKAQEKEAFGTPVLSLEEATETTLNVRITAGENGTTGGLSVRWMTLEDYEAFGWNNDLAGHVQLTSNPQHPEYSLAEGGFYIFNLQDFIDAEDYLENGTSYNRPLECGLSYMFIVQATQDGKMSKSEYSAELEFSTAACGSCTYGKGWWRNHSTDSPGNQENLWPVDMTLKLGDKEDYTQDQWNVIFDSNNKDSDYKNSNGLVNFAQHLMTAKLNVANGVDDSEIASVIQEADALIGDKILPGAAFTDEEKSESVSLKDLLEAFNESNPCADDEDGSTEE